MSDIETRFIDLQIEASTDQGGVPHIIGIAPVYGALSADLGGFREIIEPGALDAVLASADVRGRFDHDVVLARSKNGTLKLENRADGLHYDIEVNPLDVEAMSIYEKVKRGDVDGSSFMFRVPQGGDAFERTADGIVRRVVQIAELLDVGPVVYPAYPQTTAQVRTLVQEITAAGAAADQPAADAQARLSVQSKRLEIAEKL
jgi:HK97 family phage prohead protease